MSISNQQAVFSEQKKRVSNEWERFVARYQLMRTKYPVINVVGTNGKSSTTCLLSKQLTASYHQVGTFMSPSLWFHNERIKINGIMIPDERLRDIIEQLTPLWSNYQLSFFEKWLAIAITYFNQQGINIAVVEAGIGGQKDPTHIFTNQKLVLLTSVDIDHTNFLGSTVKSIITRKVGICQTHTPLITAPSNQGYVKLINRAVLVAPMLKFSDNQFTINHQDNISLVTAALKQLKHPINPDWWETPLAGRFTILKDYPQIIIDGAHNAQGIRNLIKETNWRGGPSPLWLVGCAKDRNGTIILKMLTDYNIDFVVTAFNHPFSWECPPRYPQVKWLAWLPTNLQRPLVITGSLYFVPLVIKWLQQQAGT